MVLFTCNCLNVTLICDKVDENFDIKKLESSPGEQRDIFFSEKLVSCPLSSYKVEVVQPTLIGKRTTGCWTIHLCFVCDQYTHATMLDKHNFILIPKSLQTTQDKINYLKNTKTISPVYHILVPEVAHDIDMKENVDTTNIKSSYKRTLPSSPTQQAISNLTKQLNKTLESELEALDESVRQFRDQKYAEFEAYREKALRDHKILSSILNKAKKNERADVNLDGGPPSPQLPPIQRRRLPSIKDAKKSSHTEKQIRDSSEDRQEEDLLDPEDVFDLEGIEFHNDAATDRDQYDSDEDTNVEAVPIPRRRAGRPSNVACSVPINVPFVDRRHPRDRDLDDEEVGTQDIAASIKALARSVHGDPYDLPRPRFHSEL